MRAGIGRRCDWDRRAYRRFRCVASLARYDHRLTIAAGACVIFVPRFLRFRRQES
jgi:hypothetical protein